MAENLVLEGMEECVLQEWARMLILMELLELGEKRSYQGKAAGALIEVGFRFLHI